jgi:hypothetical protein
MRIITRLIYTIAIIIARLRIALQISGIQDLGLNTIGPRFDF